MRGALSVAGLLVFTVLLLALGCSRPPPQAGPVGPMPDVGPDATAAGPETQPFVGSPGAGKREADLSDKRIAMVVAPKDFRDEEFETPYQKLGGFGAKITVASLIEGECVGVKGTKVQAVIAVKDLVPKDYDALVFIGGPGMVEHVENAQFIAAAQAFAKAGKLVAAICVSPVILAKAGLLKGLRATVSPGMEEELTERGAQVTSDDVVVSGRIITANGPSASAAFARAIAAAL